MRILFTQIGRITVTIQSKLIDLTTRQCPYVIKKYGEVTYMYVIDKEGLHVYQYGSTVVPQGLIQSTPMEDIIREDLQIFIDSIPEFRRFMGSYV